MINDHYLPYEESIILDDEMTEILLKVLKLNPWADLLLEFLM